MTAVAIGVLIPFAMFDNWMDALDVDGLLRIVRRAGDD